MDINIESELIEETEDGFCISNTDIPIYQVLSDLAGGASLVEISEDYEVDESIFSQLLQDLSECFR